MCESYFPILFSGPSRKIGYSYGASRMAKHEKLSVGALNTLRICAEIEEECAHIYWYFSGLFKHDPHAHDLWHKTAREEEEHAAQFKLASRLQGAGMSSVTMDEDKAKSMLAEIRAIHDRVRNCPPSLADALMIAIKAEEILSDYHVSDLVGFSDKRLKELFTSMKNNDREHSEILQREYDLLVTN
jgi:rubrerythrin